VTLALLAACCTLIVFAAACVPASLLLMLHWRLRRASWMRRSATSLLIYRSLPAGISAALAWLVVLPAFIAHEPRGDVEAISLPLAAAAAPGLLILGAAIVRGLVAVRRTRRALRGWLRTAAPVQVPGWRGPARIVQADAAGVCVVGIVRPILLVARKAVETCTPAELSGVVAHEKAHLATGDTWKRLMLRCMPDVLGMTPLARQIESTWLARAEEEADAAAVSGDRARGAQMACALVKLARGHVGSALPLVTSFDAGGPLERRVRRLLRGAPPAQEARQSPWTIPGAALAASTLILCALTLVSRAVHQVIEALVQALV